MRFITFTLVLLFINGCTGCGVGCTNCGGISHVCHGCTDGYWLNNKDCARCPENCKTCSDNTHCTECKTGFLDTSCLLGCGEGCKTCAAISQYCFDCKYGYWLHNSKCARCPEICELCSDNTHCSKCINGYYEYVEGGLKTCQRCSNNCNLCQSVGICLDCDTGFYKRSYESSPGQLVTLCFSCLPDCEECEASNKCTLCKPGKYGSSCQYYCIDLHCNRCTEERNGQNCTECVVGYTLDGNTCIPEIICSPNCANGCGKNGECIGGCKDGWTGQMCEVECAVRCQRCQHNDKNLCTMCKDAFYTEHCTVACNSQCSRESDKETCNLFDGFCLNGCLDGYWGSQCNIMCNEHCISERCNQTDGYCETCQRNHYGPACEHTCSEHCGDDGSIRHICRKNDGRCELGCKDEYIGDMCEYHTRVTTFITLDKSDETKFFLLGVVSGVVISLMVAGGFGLICYLRRRQKTTSEKNNTAENMEQKDYENTAMEMRTAPPARPDYANENQEYEQTSLQASPNVYERLQDNRQDEQQQYSDTILK